MARLARADFLRAGATGALMAAAPAGLLPASVAVAQGPPAPTPAGDDLGFVQFGVVAELTSRAFYREAQRAERLFTAPERRRMALARRAKRAQIVKLNALLAEDAVVPGDFEVAFAPGSFATRARALSLGERLERLLVGTYLSGVAFSADPGTRLLLGRLLVNSGQWRSALRVMAGLPAAGGLPEPLDLERAGGALDELIRVPDAPA